jgi:hypothetical protein
MFLTPRFCYVVYPLYNTAIVRESNVRQNSVPLGEPEHMSHNPYQSPEHSTDLGRCDDGFHPVREVGRFFLHTLITSVLAPWAGGAVYTFFAVDWRDTNIASRVLGSVVGSPILLFFVWFIVIPFGLLTYIVCFALRELNQTGRPLCWAVGGDVTGLAFGLFMTAFTCLPVGLMGADGAVVGVVMGMALQRLWNWE